MAERCGRGRDDNCENGSSSYLDILKMTWEHVDCLLMTPADCTFDLVIDKGDMDCVMCSSYEIERRMNMYMDELEKVLRMGDLT